MHRTGTNASQTVSRRARVHCRSQAQLLPPAVAHAVPPRCLHVPPMPTAGHGNASQHPANAWQRCDRCRTQERLPHPPVPSLLLWRPVCTTPRITNAATAAAAVVVDAEGQFGSRASPPLDVSGALLGWPGGRAPAAPWLAGGRSSPNVDLVLVLAAGRIRTDQAVPGAVLLLDNYPNPDPLLHTHRSHCCTAAALRAPPWGHPP
jgi:hypothetical protein